MRDNHAQRRCDRIIDYIQNQGVVILRDAVQMAELHSIICKDLVPILAEEGETARKINAIYLYDMDAQPPEVNEHTHDAICWWHQTGDDGVLYAIGISTQALACGEQYTALCFLHELTHVKTAEGHTPTFYRLLDAVLERCRELTGILVFSDQDAAGRYFDYRTGKPI